MSCDRESLLQKRISAAAILLVFSLSLLPAIAQAAPPANPPATFTVPATDSNGSYSISWSTVSTSTKYELQESVNGGSWSTIQNTSATSKSFSGKTSGSYGYQIRACNADGCSAYSETKTTDVAIVPGVPNAGLSVTLGPDGTSISVDWNAVSGATSYQVQQRIMGGSWSQVYSGSALIAEITGLSAAYYENQVRACKTVGSYTSCSAWSNSTYGRVPGLGGDGAPADSDSYTFSSNTIQYIDFDGIFTLKWSAMTIATYNGPITATYYYVNSVKVTSKSKSYTDQTTGLNNYNVQGCTVTQLQGDTSPKEYCSSYLGMQVLVQKIAPNPATFEAFVPNVCGTPPSIPPSVTVNWEP
ncbi:MAG TPA: hypothetical protein VFX02_00955, partial [Gammaproteobacteria bacterium]|nr:hypothetical protein [Gammaproteobacteria bacterium]